VDVGPADGRPDADGLGAVVPTLERASSVSLGSYRWRIAFWVFAAVGLAWCLLFSLWFRNRPEEKPRVNAAELALIRGDGAANWPAMPAFPGGGSSAAGPCGAVRHVFLPVL